MRWKPLQDRKPPAPVEWLMVILTAPLWVPLIALLWFEQVKCKWLGPTSEWRPWFAWHPVRVDNAGSVWLEWLERRESWGRADYRTLEMAHADR